MVSSPSDALAAVAVFADGQDDATRARAARLAERLALSVVDKAVGGYDLLLAVTDERLELRSSGRGGPGPVFVDFVRGRTGYARRVNRFGLLFRAIGLRGEPPSVIDATAGLGRDAFLLAHHGCRVLAVERSPILAALLQDGLDRAAGAAELQDVIGERLRLVVADARTLLKNLPASDAPEVIYLDPMFPPKKKSALVKKEMRVLRRLVGDDEDAGELFEIAKAVARKRVVVKRLRHATPLALHPTRSYEDKTTRYDVYDGPP